jgi:hypothetical protein
MCWKKLGQVFNVQNNGHVWIYIRYKYLNAVACLTPVVSKAYPAPTV